MKLITAPNTIIVDKNPSVFLAGSIEVGVAERWQDIVINALSDEDITLLNPRRASWDASWKQDIENPVFKEQVSWELDALEKASMIIMYFDKNTKSPITLLELGLYAQSGKLLVCCPDGFWRKGNVDIVCERYKIEVLTDFKSALDQLHMLLVK